MHGTKTVIVNHPEFSKRTMRLSTKLMIAMSLVAGIFYVSVRSTAADQPGFTVDATKNLYTADLTTAIPTQLRRPDDGLCDQHKHCRADCG